MIKRSNQYKNIPDNWKYIKRSNNPEKSIALKARFILCVVLDQIKKYGHAILTHEELTNITETQHDQNCILIKQLGLVLNIEFFRSIVENGKKYRDGYKFTLAKNAEEILQNSLNKRGGFYE